MVLGTSSGAGKTLMTAALCRVLKRQGEQPLPFKGQNMSNNAWVDASGGEMAYSQAMQAWAAELEPCCAMNPVLLKPRGDNTSEIIHCGYSVGITRAEHYYRDWFRPGWRAIRSGLNQLQQRWQGGRLVLEGAGSPVEVNLQQRDLTNLRLAQYLRANCLLVADIERGGVFAQIVGTLALLRPVERSLIKGILINRFRGRRELFDQGRTWLEENTGVPVLGVVPWLNEIFPPEDTLDLLERKSNKSSADLDIVVLRLPCLSNFSDLDPLETESAVRLRWVSPGDHLGHPDAVIIPGSKQTLCDLEAIRKYGLDQDLTAYTRDGGSILSICGGMQLLGEWLTDPEQLEGGAGPGPWPGLGLLPITTCFRRNKILRQREVQSTWPSVSTIQGFELHQGSTTAKIKLPLFSTDPSLGWWTKTTRGGSIIGTYLHGILDNGPWRRHWLNQLRARKNLPFLPTNCSHHGEHRDRLLDRLADAFKEHVNFSPLL
ncbi:cobyric acid synthase [Synechococcus sp. M16CYN]|uniref:cobyric acid synthase n=1 Tax=Synechococcus sp. M16CYN TaxID=3103139 RepID=UPI003255B361